MSLEEVVLRPRFKKIIPLASEVVLQRLEATKEIQKDLIVKRIDNHVFIRIPKERQHFWSPQLQLEVDEINEHSCEMYGLFGPSPTVWTFFMFLHFLVACLFIGFGIWAYTNAALDTSYTIQVAFMFFMVVIWFLLYIAGRWGRSAGKPEMKELFQFVTKTIKIE